MNLTALLPAWPKSTPGATPTPAFSRSSKANLLLSSVHFYASAKTQNAPWGITGMPKPTWRISSTINLRRLS